MMGENNQRKIHETTIRLDVDMANRLGVVAQVLGKSRQELMNQAVTESVITYEGDPEYQKLRKQWISNLAKVGN
jgi:predicted transcriptional regulator